MATYKDIQEYVKRRYGYTVKTCWIAHVKEICGLPINNAANRISYSRTNPCPYDKVNSIMEAFKYFGMITDRPLANNTELAKSFEKVKERTSSKTKIIAVVLAGFILTSVLRLNFGLVLLFRFYHTPYLLFFWSMDLGNSRC